jgi:hypothetical protein
VVFFWGSAMEKFNRFDEIYRFAKSVCLGNPISEKRALELNETIHKKQDFFLHFAGSTPVDGLRDWTQGSIRWW